MGKPPIVTFLSDFGTREFYLAAVKGVILEHCPEAQIIDISHEIRSHDLLEGAFTLAAAVPSFPRGTVHLAVVDPEVGSSRRVIAATDGTHFFVGPDNGIFSLIYDQTTMSRVISIEAEHHFRQPVSSTFHARDIFAPITGKLAKGIELGMLGNPIQDYARFNLPPLKASDQGDLEALVLHIDKFGNVITNIRPADLEAREMSVDKLHLQIGDCLVERHYSFYAEAQPEELFTLWGSSGYLEIAANRQPAANRLKIRRGGKIRLRC